MARTIFPIAALLLLLVAGAVLIEKVDRTECEEENEEWMRLPINARVLEKYVDTANHNLRTLVMMERGWRIPHHRYDLFEQLEVGDSIAKGANSEEGMIYSNGLPVRPFRLNVSCN